MFKSINSIHLQNFLNSFTNPDVKGLIQSFTTETGFLLGWVHFLALDLLLGYDLSLNAYRNGFSKIFVIPLLFITFFFTPVGFLLFTIIKVFNREDTRTKIE